MTGPGQDVTWWHFGHEADVGIAGRGRSLAEAFEQGALAMMRVITMEPIAEAECVHIECAAPDFELLYVEWLNALVYAMATRHLLFARFQVHVDGRRLVASAWGERLDRERHRPVVEVKGATYTALRVAQDDAGRWVAECVIDV